MLVVPLFSAAPVHVSHGLLVHLQVNLWSDTVKFGNVPAEYPPPSEKEITDHTTNFSDVRSRLACCCVQIALLHLFAVLAGPWLEGLG